MKNKIIALLTIPLFITGMNVRANQDLNSHSQHYQVSDFEQVVIKNLVEETFKQMDDEGLLTNVNDNTIAVAKNMTTRMVSDQELFSSYLTGDLQLDEQFVADYFIKDTFEKAVDTIKDIGDKTISGIKSAAEKAKDIAEKAAKEAAHIAKVATQKIVEGVKKAVPIVVNGLKDTVHYVNYGLNYVNNNETVQKILRTSIMVADQVLIYGSPLLSSAVGFIPVAGPVLSVVIGKGGPILAKVVTPDNVTKALKIAGAVTDIADKTINPERAAAEAPVMANLEIAVNPENSATLKQKQDAILLALKGGKALEEYLAKLNPQQRKDVLDKNPQIAKAEQQFRQMLEQFANKSGVLHLAADQKIKNLAGNLCLDVSSNTVNDNGGKVQIYGCHGQPNQRFTLTEEGKIINSANGKCLDVARPDYDSNKVGGKVQMWNCGPASQPNQQWHFDDKERLVTNNGLCLDVWLQDTSKNGGHVQVYTCHDGSNQKWKTE